MSRKSRTQKQRSAQRKRDEAATPKKEFISNMDGQLQAMSDTAGLFSPRQFASITDTLVKASKRRDAELQKYMNRQAAPAPTMQASHHEASVTPVSEVSRGSGSDDSRVEVEQVRKPAREHVVRDDHSAFDRTFSTTGVYDPQVWWRNDYGTDGTDGTDDPKMMPANPVQTQQPSGMSAKDKVDETDDVQQKLERADSQAQKTAIADPNGNDVRAMLADLDSNTQESAGVDAKNKDRDVHKLKQVLAEFDMLEALASKLGIDDDEADSVGDPKAMLEEIERSAKIARHLNKDDGAAAKYDDPKAMLAELDAKTQDSDSDEDDLDAHRVRLTTMFSPDRKPASQGFHHTVKDTADGIKSPGAHHDLAGTLEPGSIPYAVALMLENAGIKWEEINGWCKHFFSSGMDGWEAKKEREEMVKREQAKLDVLIEQTLEDEKVHLAVEEKQKLPLRLIVKNLAADIDTDAIRMFFKRFVWDIIDVTLLPERDPVKRTRTAHVDMDSRWAAVRASYEVGGIYGLVIKIQLAV